MGGIKIEALEETRDFYKMELEKKELTEIERNKYSGALKLIEEFIAKKKNPGEEKNKRLKHCKEHKKDYRVAKKLWRIKNKERVRGI